MSVEIPRCGEGSEILEFSRDTNKILVVIWVNIRFFYKDVLNHTFTRRKTNR